MVKYCMLTGLYVSKTLKNVYMLFYGVFAELESMKIANILNWWH